MIIKSVATEFGNVETSAIVSRADNGQVILHIVSKLGAATHEHRVTVGAEDGKDSVAMLSEADLQVSLQKHLDEKRNEAVQILAGRARVARISGNLL
jgi:hypothetical protein